MSIKKYIKLIKSHIGISLLFIFIIKCPLQSQNIIVGDMKIATSLVDNLALEGFQNIGIKKNEESLVIAYENRVYRFSPLGLKRVIEITKYTLNEKEHDFKNITFITKRHNIPEISGTWKIGKEFRRSIYSFD